MIYGKLGNPICQTVGCFDLAEDGKTKCDFCVDTGLEITRWQHIEVEFEALKE